MQTDHDKLWIYCQEENYAGTRSIIHLGDRAAGAAAGDRAVPEFPAAVLPVLGLENHSAADVRQPAYQVRQGRHFPYPVPDLFHCSCRRDGHGKHSGRGGGSLSGRCRCNFLDVGIRPAGHGSDLQRKCTGSAVCPHTPRRHGSGCTVPFWQYFTVFAASVLRWAWAT